MLLKAVVCLETSTLMVPDVVTVDDGEWLKISVNGIRNRSVNERARLTNERDERDHVEESMVVGANVVFEDSLHQAARVRRQHPWNCDDAWNRWTKG